jgi:hypothetical protein
MRYRFCSEPGEHGVFGNRRLPPPLPSRTTMSDNFCSSICTFLPLRHTERTKIGSLEFVLGCFNLSNKPYIREVLLAIPLG